jgi:hypothetical protein
MVQDPLAGIEPPVNVTDEVLVVTVPPHVLLAAPEMVTPLGSVSTKGAVKLATAASALLKVIVSVDVPPALIVAGLKALPSVGAVGTAQAEMVTALESIVTAPFCARARPDTVASVVSVILVRARIFPMKVELVPIVAELPTCQKTSQA